MRVKGIGLNFNTDFYILPVCTERNQWKRFNWNMCDGMFLGGSLVTTKEKLIACAPRWGRPPRERSLAAGGTEGACYSLNLAGLNKPSNGLRASQNQILSPFTDAQHTTSGIDFCFPKIPINSE